MDAAPFSRSGAVAAYSAAALVGLAVGLCRAVSASSAPLALVSTSTLPLPNAPTVARPLSRTAMPLTTERLRSQSMSAPSRTDLHQAPQLFTATQPGPRPAAALAGLVGAGLGLAAAYVARARRGAPPAPALALLAASGSATPPATEAPRDDDVLPESLLDAIENAARATAAAFAVGSTRCIAEVLVEGFWDPVSGPVFMDDGDNERWWELNRRYIDHLTSAGRFENVQVFFPDMGVAAMLTRKWRDATFRLASIEARGSRDVVPAGTDLVVFAAADPTATEGILRIVSALPLNVCVAMFNPRLFSGDVGIGLNVRRLREEFLSQFVTAYSIRPLSGIGAIFKCFPAEWKLFINDPDAEGRYKLVCEQSTRPAGDELDRLLRDALAPRDAQGNVVEPSLLEQAGMAFSSLTGFMRKL